MSFSWFQTRQTGGQQYSDTSPFSVPKSDPSLVVTNKNEPTWAKCYNSFTALIYKCPVFAPAPGIPFQPSLMFASKAEACPSEASIRRTILGQAHGLIHW